MTTREAVYLTLEDESHWTLPSRVIRTGISILIIANGAAVVLESCEDLQRQFGAFFMAFEYVSVAIFAVEYALRLWSITLDSRYAGAVTGRLRFMMSPLALIDLLAIAPAFLPMVFPVDLRTLRLLRLLRILRMLKLARYSHAVQLLSTAFRKKREEIAVVLFVLAVVLVVSSSIMFNVEHDAQPGVFSSIPATMYWGLSTLTTVGYGDMCPVTPLGKLFSMIIAVSGTGLFALPAAIWGAALLESLATQKSGGHTCPHCGKELGK
ncbi:MAG: ion transporter [Phycisphaerae bacterium]|nr:ion transporter [Phycisphaerae bacterium]